MIDFDYTCYAVVTERDTTNPFLSGGATLIETHIKDAQRLGDQQSRAYRLQGPIGGGYGRTLVVELAAIDQREIDAGLSQRPSHDGSVLYAPAVWDANDPDGPLILETQIRDASSLKKQLERIEWLRSQGSKDLLDSRILRFHV
ncbi:hypothetical protein [Thioalkalivibrio sp. ALMg11]|uniref:hypothetical protein n=1 Tax=Thioalkalivibrio sp. ALMg11 TaxID=1158165 RepID=UPI00037160A0|nr:hypothetical protein [Thioalkalivibrio sp. ALMg11]